MTRRIVLCEAELNAKVMEGRHAIAQVWSGDNSPPHMIHVERLAREIAYLPDLLAACRDLAARLDGEDILNPRQTAALRKMTSAMAKMEPKC